MKNTLLAAGAAAAFLVLTPAAALAATPTGTPTTEPSKSAPEYPDGPMTRITRQLTVVPGRAAPGSLVKLDFACRTRGPEEKVSVASAAITYDVHGKSATAKVNQVKPGKYAVTLHCGPEKSTAYLEVLGAKKQVAKVPAGAPQTGGTDGPVDGSPAGPLAAAGAMGVLALGGGGLVLARRTRRD
ncbi:hypothetical protein OHS18_35515 [Amycolatopsis sp. NBC_00355]|uniref:hypothetical protein n=1 Tax=Amycolatopsis sp. NBC_00355 TaxID=2975957 RepID=UPI002E268B4C